MSFLDIIDNKPEEEFQRHLSVTVNDFTPLILYNNESFTSYQDLCVAKHFDFTLFKNRMRNGMRLDEILNTPKKIHERESVIFDILNDMGWYPEHDITIQTLYNKYDLQNQYTTALNQYEILCKNSNIHIGKHRIKNFKFDFTLIQRGKIFGFIEEDGTYHFRNGSSGVHERDIAKNLFAEANRIPLLRIRIDQFSVDTVRNMISNFIDYPTDYISKHNLNIAEDEYWTYDTNKLVS